MISLVKPELSNLINWFRPVCGENLIDIQPYEMGNRDPNVLKGYEKVGNLTYVLKIFFHLLTDGKVICLHKTLDQPCPICIKVNELICAQEIVNNKLGHNVPELDEKISKLKVKTYPMCFYNILVDSKPHVWMINGFSSETQLLKASLILIPFKDHRGRQIYSIDENGDLIPDTFKNRIIFSNPNAGESGGRHITFDYSIQGHKYANFSNYQLHIRKNSIPISDFQIDSILEIPSYDTIESYLDEEEK